MKLYFCPECALLRRSKDSDCDNCGNSSPDPIEGEFDAENAEALKLATGIGNGEEDE